MNTMKSVSSAARGTPSQPETTHPPPKEVFVQKGANGVLLKKFEAILCDIFSASSSPSSHPEICHQALRALTPQYSKLPPFLDESEREEIVEKARISWDKVSPYFVKANETSSQLSPWPFDERTAIPSCGCVRGKESDSTHKNKRKPKKTKTGKDIGGVGDVFNQQRAWRKEMQLANMIQCVMALLPDHVIQPVRSNGGESNRRKFRIVDFAGGTGHLAVPLALLLPHCEVVCVDLKKWSLDLLHRRVDCLMAADDNGSKDEDNSFFEKNTRNGQHKLHCNANSVQISQHIPNLSTYLGSIQSFTDDFDIGISLHACGDASDCVLRKCLERKASWVVCSCCCGKLRTDARNPYIFQSTGGNEKEILYPQSKTFASFMNTRMDDCDVGSNERCVLLAEKFDEVARAADFSELGDVRKPRNACRRAAKSLVEWDRLLYCKEYNNDNSVNAVLTRMVPWEASTKNDILIGWYDPSCNPYRVRRTASNKTSMSEKDTTSGTPADDLSAQVDFQIALQHLFGLTPTAEAGKKILPVMACHDQNDWSEQEVTEIQMQLEIFLKNGDDPFFRFHRGMGPRKRKLIHYVAEKLGLRHWGEGKKDSEKVVVVARRND